MEEDYKSRLPVLKNYSEVNGQNVHDNKTHGNKFIEAMAMESRIPISNRHFDVNNGNNLTPNFRNSSGKSTGTFILSITYFLQTVLTSCTDIT